MKNSDMENVKKLLGQPVFFKKNRVYRVYKGGLGFSDLVGDGSVDGTFPEEWLASRVKAINPVYFGERDGVSVTTDGYFFDDLLAEFPDLLTGNRKYDCLVKFLDSAIRLPMQVHPTKEFAKKHFGSPYGKTEAWLVLATRPGAKIYFGFNRNISKNELSELETKSETDKNIMESVLNGVDAKVGDVYIINAGLIHAIGAGCTILEVQEPTDFTIQPERWCGDYHIGYEEEYIGLSKEVALDCFDYSLVKDKALLSAKIKPIVEYDDGKLKKESLISYDVTSCFAENRYTLSHGGKLIPDYGPSVWICLSGNGVIKGENYSREIKKGEYFFLPYAAQGKFVIETDKEAVFAECLPSKQD